MIDPAWPDRLERLARRAGDAIMAVYARDISVTQKADHSPVTDADLAAHRVIVDGLAAWPEAIPVLSEEDTASFAGADGQGRYWLVDPLDGTREFIRRNDEFTVNIALVENGRPVLGVVLVPVTGVAYVAARGQGAWKVAAEGRQREPIRVAGRPAAGACWRVLGSRSHANAGGSDWLEALGEYRLIPVGSSLKSCLVAEGQADVYPRPGPTCLWDTAAAQVVLEQAGGRMVAGVGSAPDPAGEPLNYATPAQTRNPAFVAWGF